MLIAAAALILTSCGDGLTDAVQLVDATPPRIVSVSPSDSTTAVPLNTVLTATFSETVNASTVNGSSFTLTSTDGSSVASVVTLDGEMAVFRPANGLSGNTRYTAVISRDVKDVAGNPIASNFAWSFVTAPAPDVTAPTVIGTTPAAGSTGVPSNAVLSATFSEPMAPATLTASSVRVTNASGTAVPGAITVSGNTTFFAPTVSLAPNTQYTGTVTTEARDLAGNQLASAVVWTFTTGAAPDNIAPTITAFTPANAATNVAVGSAPTVTFSELMSSSSLNGASFTLVAAGGSVVAGSVTLSGNTATFTPNAALAGGTSFTATVTTAAQDAAGNSLASNTSWTFTTAAATDGTAPIIVGNTPANGATNVAVGVAPTVTFSEPMRTSSITSSSFVLSAAGGASVPASVTTSGNGAMLTPDAPLANNTQYTATLTTAVRDVAGNALASNAFWSFTTAAAQDATPPTIAASTPANGATNVAVSAAPTVTFSEPMQLSTLNTTSFVLRTTSGGTSVAATITASGNTATLTPSAALANNTQYTATVTTGARDIAGNALAANASWNFTTDPGPITSIVVTPGSSSVVTGATQQFSATGRRTSSPTTPVTVAVTWAATGGSVSSNGLFTAGSTAGSSYLVTATLVGASPVAGQANVAVTTAPAPAPVGNWVNVTPSNMDFTNRLSCDNYGVETVQVDPTAPSNVYAFVHCQGVWESQDYGATWTGPISPANVRDCAGGIRVGQNGVMYLACIRGAAMGFWRSLDKGRSFTRYQVGPAPSNRQDVYPPVVDPQDPQHLLIAGHEFDLIAESTNGGQTWTNVPMNPGMLQGAGTGSINFINTGNPATTRSTFLWTAQASDRYGAWRTTNGGASWTKVEKNEHAHGYAELHQPDASGVVYMAGVYSDLGWGILRSTDYGQTWAHVGMRGNQRVVISTPRTIFGSYSYPSGLGTSAGPSMQRAAQPGTGAWTSMPTPAGMTQGASQGTVTTDGVNTYVITANYHAGLWRYVEPR